MRTIVLVHGAWHGPWCWSPVLARLDELGAASVAVELDLLDVHRDAEIVKEAIDAIDGPVVLVGHSYGGAVITEAGIHPSVEQLLYLCAFAPDAGETVLGLALEHGTQSDLGGALVPQGDGTNTLNMDLVADLLYNDCSPADVEMAMGLLRRQGDATFVQELSAVAWRERPTTYVVCGNDNTVDPGLQRHMAGRIPDAAVVEWPDSSHSPFFSRPGELAELLASLSA